MQLSFGFRPTGTSIRGRDKSVIDLVVAENVVAEKCRIKPHSVKSWLSETPDALSSRVAIRRHQFQ
jgi:hypothetical protein